MSVRQGDNYTATNNAVDPTSITINLKNPTGAIVIENAIPTLDPDTDQYSYQYTFPTDADVGNWTFSWNIDGVVTDEIVLLQEALSAIYADPDEVQKLTREVREGLHNTDDYEDLLVRALTYSDRKINNRLKKEGISTPVPGDDDLSEAGNLYAAYLIFNTYYSDNDRTTPTAAGYKADADEFIEAYIDSLEKTEDTQSRYQSSQLQGNTIHDILGHDHPEHPYERWR